MMLGEERLEFFSVGVGDFVGSPGAMKSFFKGETEEGGAVNAQAVRAIDCPEFIEKGARLNKMDEQGLEASIMIPTLGVGVEYQMRDKKHQDILYPSLRAFNRWLAEDWGWGTDGRVFAVASISLFDVDQAVLELERLAKEGCRLVHVNSGPVNGKSPADPAFDAFWARMQALQIICVFHIGSNPFNEMYAAQWGEPANPPSHRFTGMNMFLGMGERTIVDQIAAMIYHNLFGRFPQLRMMVIEFGASWVPHLVSVLDKIHRMGDHKSKWPFGKPETPSDVFKKHFKIVPFYEDDMQAIAKAIGVDAMVMGSDYPHPEGLLWPVEMEEEFDGFSDADIRKMMRSNAASWLGLAE
jgi:predicted TIM-barrel fold metal-dependent hydrolase